MSPFCFGRTCISITIKFINEVVNGRVTIILFVVTNIVCVPPQPGVPRPPAQLRAVSKLFKNSGVEFLDPLS